MRLRTMTKISSATLVALLAFSLCPSSASAQFQGPAGRNPEALQDGLKATAGRNAAESQIRAKWEALGGSPGAPSVAGDAGLIAIGDGFYRQYARSNDRIYYRPGAKPVFVYGAIGDKYVQLGGPQSWLGWPTGDEEPFDRGGRVAPFANGNIYWWSNTGAIESGDVVLRYTGLYAFGETDDDQLSSGDEPYVIFSTLVGPPAVTTTAMTRIYGEGKPDSSVDAGEAREDSIELYRGPPRRLTVSATLMEHDLSDAGAKRQQVGAAAQLLHETGRDAALLIPVVGPAASAALEAAWQAYGDDIKKAMGDSFDFEDDYIATETNYISAYEMLALSRAPRQSKKGIRWHIDSPLLSGQGGSWKTYYTVEAVPHAPAPPVPPEAQPARLQVVTQQFWVERQDIARTPWAFSDVNQVAWARASRAAAQLCTQRGFAGGHFTGHQDLGKGVFGLQCSGLGTIWSDVPLVSGAAPQWPFKSVDEVNWAQAGRAAERHCAFANGGFAGGQFNGHQVDGKLGLFCYRDGARWFDATDAELAATGWGFPTPRLDDVLWAQAMRAANGYCISKGYQTGFMNGHQGPNRYGVVCQR